MILRRLLIAIMLLTSTIWSQAQQINAVPDYVFRNQMSVGRNAVTDTAAYFSIGPRYGANKGFMPPIVGDTATFSSGKRNGLLIFSVQKNKFLYWDSVRVQWSDMAGSSGTYIVAGDTAAMLLPYLRKADTTAMLSPYYRSATATAALALKVNISDTSTMLGNYVRHAGYGLTKSGQSFLVDTLNISTRAWRQKGLDSLAALEVSGSGTTNYVPKFTAASTIGNSQIFDNGTNVGIGITTGMSERFNVANSGGNANASISTSSAISGAFLRFGNTVNSDGLYLGYNNPGGTLFGGVGGANGAAIMGYGSYSMGFGTNATERLRITSGGDVGIGTASPNTKLSVVGNVDFRNAATGLGSGYGLELSTNSSTPRISLVDNGVYAGEFFSSSSIVGIKNVSNNAITFGTNNTERLRIFANGRIGVNTTTDAGYQFDVNGTARINNDLRINSTAGFNTLFTQPIGGGGLGMVSLTDPVSADQRLYSLGFGSVNYPAQARIEGIATEAWSSTNRGSSLRFNTTANGASGSSVRMYIGNDGAVGINTSSPSYTLDINGTLRSVNGANFATTSGNVGIGTASPGAKLTVLGAGAQTILNSGSAADARMEFQYNSTRKGAISWDVNNVRLFADAGNYLTFWPANAEAMRLNTAGEVIIDASGTDAGDYKLQVSGNIYGSGLAKINDLFINGNSPFVTGANVYTNGQSLAIGTQGANLMSFFTNNAERGRINSAGEWIIDASGTDAGDYKLQVVGNARVGTGKLDIASNTTFGLGIARSGTSEVAGQIYNSNGILYTGVESSAGGQIFSGSSAYAAVIGSGANYPLQFAVNNITRGGFSTSGNLLLGFTTDSYFLKLQVNGSIFSNNQFFGQGPNAQLSIDSSTNISPLYVSAQSLTGTSAQAMLYSNTTWNTTGNPSLLDLNVTNTASGATSNYMKITDGTNTFRVTKAAEVVTAAPTGGSIRKWKLGEAATVSPTSPNRTIRVEIDGTVYYLHAKTTND